jgi:Zn-finger protein
MIEKARDHIQKVLETKKTGPNKSCEYYPCHHEGQDCTWCFCPFYPCGDGRTGGKVVKSKKTGRDVWSCIDCIWIHEGDVARRVMEELEKLGGMDGWDEETLSHIREKFL